MPLLHPEADAILARLNKERINYLYHFTSIENLPMIYHRRALCSKSVLMSENKWPPIPGGNALSHNLDRFNGNWNKVSLSFTPYTPMAYGKKRKDHLCYFLVSPEVATWIGVVFTDSNAAGTSDQHRAEGLEGLNNIKFEFVHSVQPWSQNWKRYVQAELLIPEGIPFDYIARVAFVSKASMLHATRICTPPSNVQFSVEEGLFTDAPKALKETIGFSYVIECILTDANVNKNMLYLTEAQKNKFSKSRDKFIVLVALVKATAGTKAKIFIQNIEHERNIKQLVHTTEFEASAQYRHEHPISSSSLSTGRYLLEYHLNELCWASISFEVF